MTGTRLDRIPGDILNAEESETFHVEDTLEYEVGGNYHEFKPMETYLQPVEDLDPDACDFQKEEFPYKLKKREALIFLTGYSAKVRAEIIDRLLTVIRYREAEIDFLHHRVKCPESRITSSRRHEATMELREKMKKLPPRD